LCINRRICWEEFIWLVEECSKYITNTLGGQFVLRFSFLFDFFDLPLPFGTSTWRFSLVLCSGIPFLVLYWYFISLSCSSFLFWLQFSLLLKSDQNENTLSDATHFRPFK
jgi:hypothetical protein